MVEESCVFVLAWQLLAGDLTNSSIPLVNFTDVQGLLADNELIQGALGDCLPDFVVPVTGSAKRNPKADLFNSMP